MRTRRFCRAPHHHGPRWLLHTEFHVKVWGDVEKTWPAQLQSECKACQRQRARVNRAKSRGRSTPYNPQSKMPPEEALRRKRQRYRDLMKNNPAFREHRKEYNRVYQREYGNMKRREEGTPARNFTKPRHTTRRAYLNAEPLLRYLSPHREADDRELNTTSDEMGVHNDLVFTSAQRRALDQAADKGVLTLQAADAILTSLGLPHMLALLYGDVDLSDAPTHGPGGQVNPTWICCY